MMKLQKVYSDEVQGALTQLELIISSRKDSLDKKWDDATTSVQEQWIANYQKVYGKFPLSVWYAEDTAIRECRKEIERILSVSIPVHYMVEEE